MNELSSWQGDRVEVPARFTADEFALLAATGLDARLELSGGVLERMSPAGNEHSRAQTKVMLGLFSVLGPRSEDLLRVEVGLQLDEHTVRVPDVTLLREPATGSGILLAAQAALVVEVAEGSLGRDLGVKREEYGLAGIETYWVLDTSARVTHVFWEPADGKYRDAAVIPFDQPLPVPGTDAAITLA
jgi:Uma2 family endonuclease